MTVFAGDNFYPAADASYRNLVWGNIGLSGDVEKNTEIGTIPSWGPHFRVSFDLKINSGSKAGWSSVLSFKSDGGARNMEEMGDRIPAIFLNKKGSIHFTSGVNGNRNYVFNFNSIKLNKWYSIAVEQIRNKGKVREIRIKLKKFNSCT